MNRYFKIVMLLLFLFATVNIHVMGLVYGRTANGWIVAGTSKTVKYVHVPTFYIEPSGDRHL